MVDKGRLATRMLYYTAAVLQKGRAVRRAFQISRGTCSVAEQRNGSGGSRYMDWRLWRVAEDYGCCLHSQQTVHPVPYQRRAQKLVKVK